MEILTRGTCRFFVDLFSICFSFCTVLFFPEFIRKSKINMKCPCIHSIYLITLHSYSQDGDPVPGNLPFFFFHLFFPFFTILKSNAKSPCIPLFSFQKESQHCSAINQRDPFMVSYLWLFSSAFIQGILFLAQDQSVQSKACKIGP